MRVDGGRNTDVGGHRLIETAFPVKQVSLDSVHEKNIRHGHISTLHIWPARRPLASSRAALLATLLPDPGAGLPKHQQEDARSKALRHMAGTVVEVANAAGKTKEETRDGIFRWGREGRVESDGETLGRLELYRREVEETFEGRAPRVLDPFAGGGAIPLEAMRLGCETVASDLSPVAWFVLRCTLHYPRLIGGERRAFPAFALRERGFAEKFVRGLGMKTPAALRKGLAALGHGEAGSSRFLASAEDLSPDMPVSFAWHLRAWGDRVLARARQRLASAYPTYAEFEPVRKKGRRRAYLRPEKHYEVRPPQLLEPDDEGLVSPDALNAEFDSLYLEDEDNPRWVAKPSVAYLWARTTRCAACRSEVPLLKTRWLCKKGDKRIRLTIKSDEDGLVLGVEKDVPTGEGTAAQKRTHDRELGAGTMSSSGVMCPRCGVIATMSDLRVAGRAGRIGERLTAVVVDGHNGKEYRAPTPEERDAAQVDEAVLDSLYATVPFGLPDESTPSAGSLGIRTTRYGFDTWRKLFTNRQLLVLGTLVQEVRRASDEMADRYPPEWREALTALLSLAFSKFTDYSSSLCSWHNSGEKLRNTFARFALPMVWDYCEVNPLSTTTGSLDAMTQWLARVAEHLDDATAAAPMPQVLRQSAMAPLPGPFDVICTDPPYYDAIPYSDLMDFFHVWLRRALHGLSPETDEAFAEPLGPKWNTQSQDGELIDDAARFAGDRAASKQNYEDGMARAFKRFWEALRDDGRLVVVFANKQPDAWETLVSALVRAGFVVVGSWPIQTEMQNRQRSLSSAALSSSIWLVCRKRARTAHPGWDGRVLRQMKENINARLHPLWDAGIRGPDFVWAATGPALEAFSKHPVVKVTDTPNERLTVADFLRHVRRIVVGFVVKQLLGEDDAPVQDLDDTTTYYLLHRSDFGLDPAPSGACILYAISCNLSDADLAGRHDVLARGGSRGGAQSEADDPDSPAAGSPAASGNEARLKPWHRRRSKTLGEPSSNGAPPPLIDCVHKLMQLWKTGDQSRVNAYLERRGLWRHELFAKVVQALIELAPAQSDERAILEYIQNHLAARTRVPSVRQPTLL